MIDLPQYYREKAGAFIKTVVCFDDKAEYPKKSPYIKVSTSVPSDGFEPGTPAPDDQEKKAIDAKQEDGESESDELNAHALIEAFAQKDVLCSVIAPSSEQEAIKAQILALTRVADIAILDWKLAPKDPTIARDAIVSIVKSDIECGGRVRLIAIYSDANAVDVLTELEALLKENGFSLNLEDKELKGEHALIVFFQKPKTPKPTADVVEYKDLPDRTIEEFSKLTSGLLPVAALSAITEIRQQTHHLLATFPSTLDGAFIAHRCLIPDPNDAEQFLLDIIESEIGALLRHKGVGRSVSAEKCVAWTGQIDGIAADKKPQINNLITDYCDDIKEAFRSIFPGKKLKEHEMAKKIMELLYKNTENEIDAAKIGLSILASLDASQKTKMGVMPKLQLGSIVRCISNGDYLLCVQPLCDSVRISHENGSRFPFLILKQVDDADVNASLDICLYEHNLIKWLTAKTKPSDLVSIPFKGKSDQEKYVEAVQEGESYLFCDASGKYEFEWMGELKTGKAQRVASQLAARLHTLGIDEFEWQRLRQRQAN